MFRDCLLNATTTLSWLVQSRMESGLAPIQVSLTTSATVYEAPGAMRTSQSRVQLTFFCHTTKSDGLLLGECLPIFKVYHDESKFFKTCSQDPRGTLPRKKGKTCADHPRTRRGKVHAVVLYASLIFPSPGPSGETASCTRAGLSHLKNPTLEHSTRLGQCLDVQAN